LILIINNMIIEEEHYARNNFTRRPDSHAGRCSTHLAAQQEVGVLPKRRIRPDRDHPDHPASLGTDIRKTDHGSRKSSVERKKRTTRMVVLFKIKITSHKEN
jgi:hypothetical protein